MVYSMTGFGRALNLNEKYKIIVEMKAVNHKYLDINLRIPRYFTIFDNKIRKLIGKSIKRGKIDLFINFEDYKQNINSLKYNYSIAKSYYDFAIQLQKDFDITNDLTTSKLLEQKDVIFVEENLNDDDKLWEILEPVLNEAIESFNISRNIEGRHLKLDILKKLDFLSNELEFIEVKSPQIIEAYKEKLKAKLSALLEDKSIDENRILSEVIIYADKICIDEEIVRLKSHINTAKKELLENSLLGKKLDFIVQEMNREANTILSKSSDLEIINRAISLKNEIEKIREQVQNLE